MRRHRYPVAAMIAIVLISAGCARPPAESTGDVMVTIERTGGFAGVHDTLVVTPDGQWTRTDRTGTRHSGRLADRERAQLRTLLADPRLPGEARRTPVKTSCRDAFNYAVTIGTTKVSYVDCPTDADLPAASMAIVALVESATRD